MFLELMSAVEHELSPTIMHSYRTYFPFRCIDDTYLQFFSVGNRDILSSVDKGSRKNWEKVFTYCHKNTDNVTAGTK